VGGESLAARPMGLAFVIYVPPVIPCPAPAHIPSDNKRDKLLKLLA